LGIGTVTVVNGATLAGVGSLAGDLTVNAGGTVSPGGNANIGTLTTSGNAVLQGNTAMDINASASLKDALNAGNITYGGTLTVTNLAGTPASGNSFKLFTAGSYSSNFAVTNLPALGAGLNWSWNPANGTLSVVSGMNPNPTNITASVSGNVLTLFWPLDHTGWTLQCQTNVLGAGLNPNAGAWTPVPGSTSVNTTNITIDPSQPTVFYRLKL
jgi:hypothetical protein